MVSESHSVGFVEEWGTARIGVLVKVCDGELGRMGSGRVIWEILMGTAWCVLGVDVALTRVMKRSSIP